MIYGFGEFQIDVTRAELRKGADVRAVEPQVFELIVFLAANAGRLITKDEIVEAVWDGRIVSDSAVASRIKSARQALGDDGKTQKYIKTLHGRGFRFEAQVTVDEARPDVVQVVSQTPVQDAEADDQTGDMPASNRPSIAVLPFSLIGNGGDYAGFSDALPHEIIAELSRLRWIRVIARGSTFQFRGTQIDADEIRRALGARYYVTGSIEFLGPRMTILIELTDTTDRSVVWADKFQAAIDEIHEVRGDILSNIISSLEVHISANETRRARLTAPSSLDAWSAYHLGLHHMFRFTEKDNAQAAALFQRSVDLDPTFARGFAGLSFTHFQNAFMRYSDERTQSADLAKKAAEKGMDLDDLDPFVNFTLGRACYLRGDFDQGLTWLDRSTKLSPNYAQAVYSKAWADAILGHWQMAHSLSDEAMKLSPLDPMRYAMLAARGLASIVEGDVGAAAQWSEQAARAPGAHTLIAMIAMVSHGLNQDEEKASYWAANVRQRYPQANAEHFFQSFPFADEGARERMAHILKKYGF